MALVTTRLDDIVLDFIPRPQDRLPVKVTEVYKGVKTDGTDLLVTFQSSYRCEHVTFHRTLGNKWQVKFHPRAFDLCYHYGADEVMLYPIFEKEVNGD